MIDCYFCHTPLTPFVDTKNTGNYTDHYACYKCPKVGNPYMKKTVWENRCHIIYREGMTIVAYLHFDALKLWLHTYFFDPPFMDIKDEYNKVVLRIGEAPDIWSIQPAALEAKIKTWVMFS